MNSSFEVPLTTGQYNRKQDVINRTVVLFCEPKVSTLCCASVAETCNVAHNLWTLPRCPPTTNASLNPGKRALQRCQQMWVSGKVSTLLPAFTSLPKNRCALGPARSLHCKTHFTSRSC